MANRARMILIAALALLSALPAAVFAGPRDLPGSEIVGGTIVPDVEKYPFVVAVDNVLFPGPYWCGGTMLGPTMVLTAAHCVADVQTSTFFAPGDFRVALGHLDRASIPERAWMPVKRVIPHPDYRIGAFFRGYDVALLELQRPVRGAEVIDLPKAGDRSGERTGDRVTVIGWGTKYQLGPDSARLRETTLEIVKGQICKERSVNYLGERYPVALLLCAGAPGKAFCNGDSGGPIVARHGSRWVQHGIVSGGVGCAMYGWNGFMTRLSNPDINQWVRKSAGLR